MYKRVSNASCVRPDSRTMAYAVNQCESTRVTLRFTFGNLKVFRVVTEGETFDCWQFSMLSRGSNCLRLTGLFIQSTGYSPTG